MSVQVRCCGSVGLVSWTQGQRVSGCSEILLLPVHGNVPQTRGREKLVLKAGLVWDVCIPLKVAELAEEKLPASPKVGADATIPITASD